MEKGAGTSTRRTHAQPAEAKPAGSAEALVELVGIDSHELLAEGELTPPATLRVADDYRALPLVSTRATWAARRVGRSPPGPPPRR